VVEPSSANSSWNGGAESNYVYFWAAPDFGMTTVRFEQQRQTLSTLDFYLVSRLDGPGGVTRVLDLVDQAIYGDTYINTEGIVTKKAFYVIFIAYHPLSLFLIKFLLLFRRTNGHILR